MNVTRTLFTGLGLSPLLLVWVPALGLSACGSTSNSNDGTPDSGAPEASVLDVADATAPLAADFARVSDYLLGDFDNHKQFDAGFSKLVERHVCAIPGRSSDETVRWLYVEQVEVLPDGRRDAYFTRVVELRPTLDGAVSKAYKFNGSHPLSSNAFAYNGPRDGCSKPDLLSKISDSVLTYREGCDITFVPLGTDRFRASTSGTACSFPGGYIQTSAELFKDGIETQDLTQSGGQALGDKFEFRRLAGWTVPPAKPDPDAGH